MPTETRRCRPLLGTFVEIAVERVNGPQAQGPVNAAFTAIERVHKLMSFHDPQSDVSRLNRLAFHQPVAVSTETYKVLKCAEALYQHSEGLFDIAVASQLLRWGVLPRHTFLREHQNYTGTTGDIEFLPDGLIRFMRPLCIDLGGIAKGFAVDKAIDVLRQEGVTQALVNAGGDMRCFGEEEYPVWVRHPNIPGRLLPLPGLKNAALATSANSYSTLYQLVCAQVHGRTRKPLQRSFSVSVRANSCMIADALTKVVLALGKRSDPVLSAFNASAFIVYSSDKMLCLETKQA